VHRPPQSPGRSALDRLHTFGIFSVPLPIYLGVPVVPSAWGVCHATRLAIHGRSSSMTIRRFGRVLVGSLALTAGVVGMGVSGAGASPSNAPTSLSGTFTCGGQTGTFVVNSGNAMAPVTWNVAHLTFSSGGTGIFVPTALDLTFTFMGQSQTLDATKGSAHGSVTCSIAATQDGFSLTGSVTGNIRHT
jgi:hypothetical protein